MIHGLSLLALGGLLALPCAAQAPADLSEKERQQLTETLTLSLAENISPQKFATNVAATYGSRAVPFLVQAMAQDKKARAYGVPTFFVLADLRGMLSGDAEQALIGVLKDRDGNAHIAAWALGSICSEAARDELVKAAESGNKWLETAACMSLGILGGDAAKAALLKVQSASANHDAEVIRAAGSALGLLEKFSLPDRKATLLAMIQTPGEYAHEAQGWLRTPSYAALRKAVQWQMKELAPDLRALSKSVASTSPAGLDTTGLALRLVYAAKLLGSEVTGEEADLLRKRNFLDK